MNDMNEDKLRQQIAESLKWELREVQEIPPPNPPRDDRKVNPKLGREITRFLNKKH